MSILSSISSSIDSFILSSLETAGSLIDSATEGLDIWIGFSLKCPQIALIGGWLFFLWWSLRWERAFPRSKDRKLGLLEAILQIAIIILGCFIWPFLALGKFGPQEALFKIASWGPTRFILKSLSFGA